MILKYIFIFFIPVMVFAEGEPPSGSIQGGGGNLQTEYQSDLQSCSKEKNLAETCCNDPMKCASGMSPQAQQQLMQLVALGASGAMAATGNDGGLGAEGMAMACALLGSLGSLGAGVNDGASQVCEKHQSQCGQACGAAAKKWSEKLTQCNSTSCADAQFISDAAETFNSNQGTCSSLSVNLNAMKQQSQQTGSAGDMGQLCSMMASLLPASEEEQQVAQQEVIDCNDPAQATNPLCIDCKANPENKACGQPLKSNGPGIGMASSMGLSANDFNTGSGIDGLNQDPKFGNFQPQPNSSGTVSGQGGGIPGGGNNGGGFGSDSMPQQDGGGYNTDILNGLGGGGGGSASVAAMGVDAAGGFSSYGSRSYNEEQPYEGMDLKKFLPDGAMDPNRRLASVLVSQGQINDKNANIFEKISERMKAVCNTNRLKDCGRSK